MNGIAILPDAFSAAECQPLLDLLARKAKPDIKRIEVPCQDREVWQILELFRKRVLETVRKALDTEASLEFIMLQTNRPGDKHPPHCDNVAVDGIPNYTAWRSHTANLYLNDANEHYLGGELNFPELGITIAPKRGMLVAFPSGRGYKHQVFPIIQGERHSVLSWFTMEPARALR